MSVASRALRTFVGAEGLVRRGSIILLSESQAREYERAGLTEPESVPFAPDASAVAGPSSTAVVSPEVKEGARGWNRRARVIPKHQGGGHYLVGGERVRGKAAAEARAAELNGE